MGLATFLSPTQGTSLPVAAIDDLVRNEGLVPLTEKVRLTAADLQRAAHLLRHIEGATDPSRASRPSEEPR